MQTFKEESFTVADLMKFKASLLSSATMECLLHGNICEMECKEFVSKAEAMIVSAREQCSVSKVEPLYEAVVQIPCGSFVFNRKARNDEDTNCAIEVVSCLLSCLPSWSCVYLFACVMERYTFN